MKKTFTFLAAILIITTVWAQSPEKMSYQAVVRNSENQLLTNSQVGMQISILQGSSDGVAVYVETQSPTTNANGLISIEIGNGTAITGELATIDWADGPYFIKTETDPSGGANYTVTGTSQLLSVPYALHAKTAESISGGITETDPVFMGWNRSTGIRISENQITNLGNYIETETDPVYSNSIASGITATDTTSWNHKLDSYTETDPVYNNSIASGITATDTTSWNHKLDSYTETDPVYSNSIASGITATDTTSWNHKLDSYTETDPVYSNSIASGITATDTTSWNHKLSSEVDGDITNELQTLSISNDTIFLSDGGKVKLPASGGLPDQTGMNGKYLKTDGTNASWEEGPVSPSFGYVYQLATIADATVVGGADVPFSNNGPLSGVTHTAGLTAITVPSASVYKIDYSISITAGIGSQAAIAINGIVDASTCITCLVATGNVSGTAMLTLAAGDVITLRNNSAIALTMTLAPSVGAQLSILKVQQNSNQ